MNFCDVINGRSFVNESAYQKQNGDHADKFLPRDISNFIFVINEFEKLPHLFFLADVPSTEKTFFNKLTVL